MGDFTQPGPLVLPRDNTHVSRPPLTLQRHKPRPKRNASFEKQRRLYPDLVTHEEVSDYLKREKEIRGKYRIPYDPAKEIMLTTGRYNTGRITTDVLDAIYEATKNTHTDLWTNLGIAGRETALGIARRDEDKSTTMSDLVSNWQQYQTITMTNSQIDEYNRAVKNINADKATDEDFDTYGKYYKKFRRKMQSLHDLTENPLENMFRYYATGANPNPGDPGYRDKIAEEAAMLKKDPAIQKWYKSKVPIGRQGIKMPETKEEDVPVIDPAIFTSWNSIPLSMPDLPEDTVTGPAGLPFDLPAAKPMKKETAGTAPEEETAAIVEEEETPAPPAKDGTPASFTEAYDRVEREMPVLARRYRKFLTAVARNESGFNASAKNPHAPAYGLFQFMEDGKKYHNIEAFAGTKDVKAFLADPAMQIRAAIRLAAAMERRFSADDISIAKEKGITPWGLLGGAWLGGNDNVRRYLKYGANASDRHWSPKRQGTDMITQIKRYNDL